MRVLRVKCLLFVFACIVAFNGVVAKDKLNCSAIKVPNVDLTLWDDNVMEASWMNTLFSSNVTYCVNFNGFPDQHKTLPVCPNKKICENTGKKSLQKCEIARHVPFDATVFVISSIHVPGCPMKRVNISLKVTAQVMKMWAVKDLSLTYESNALFANWSHEKDNVEYCYNYTAYETLESGKRKEITNKTIRGTKSAKVTLSTARHAYKHFEFCVKLCYCDGVGSCIGLWSDEKCAETISPPERPSEGLNMLCGSELKSECEVTKDKTERNVTLIWQLPEKSSWNGRPDKIFIVYKVANKEESDPKNITINGTRTNYTLHGLKLYVAYQVTLTFYSNGGKGPDTTILLQAVEASESPVTGNKINPTVLTIIIVASLVLIVAAVVVFTYLIYRLKRKHKLPSLPHIKQPAQVTANSGTDSNIRTNPGDYNVLMTSDETDIQPNLRDKSSYEKLSCNGSNSSESTNDSVTCPLVSRTTDQAPHGHNDVSYYPEQTGGERGSLMASGERTTDI